MLNRRICLLIVLVFLSRLLVEGAEGSNALVHYQARLEGISRAYHRQFAEIRKHQRRLGSDKADVKVAEQQIKRLAMLRTSAMAEARLIYQREEKEERDGKPADPAEVAPPAKFSRERLEREDWAARTQAVEGLQSGFWARVAREEPRIAELWTARLNTIEGEQRTFWAGVARDERAIAELWAARVQVFAEEQDGFFAQLFEGPKMAPIDVSPLAAATTEASRGQQER